MTHQVNKATKNPQVRERVFQEMTDSFFKPKFEELSDYIMGEISSIPIHSPEQLKERMEKTNALIMRRIKECMPKWKAEFSDVVLDAYNDKTIDLEDLTYVLTELEKDESINTLYRT